VRCLMASASITGDAAHAAVARVQQRQTAAAAERGSNHDAHTARNLHEFRQHHRTDANASPLAHRHLTTSRGCFSTPSGQAEGDEIILRERALPRSESAGINEDMTKRESRKRDTKNLTGVE